MNRIKKGWAVFKMSYKIAKELKTVWSLIITSLAIELVAVIILVPLSLKIFGWDFQNMETLKIVMENVSQGQILSMSIITTFVSVFIATFFNFAITYNILEFLRKKRNVGFGESISFATRRLSDITIWSLVLVTVNLIFQILNIIAERLGSIGELIMKIVNGILGTAWALLTLFVVPIYVENKEASILSVLKRSKNIFVATWGETVVATASLGIFSFLFIFGIILISVLLVVVSASSALVWVVIPVAVIVIIFTLVFNSAMDKIYKILLYLYAENKTVPEFVEDKKVIENAFEVKKS